MQQLSYIIFKVMWCKVGSLCNDDTKLIIVDVTWLWRYIWMTKKTSIDDMIWYDEHIQHNIFEQM